MRRATHAWSLAALVGWASALGCASAPPKAETPAPLSAEAQERENLRQLEEIQQTAKENREAVESAFAAHWAENCGPDHKPTRIYNEEMSCAEHDWSEVHEPSAAMAHWQVATRLAANDEQRCWAWLAMLQHSLQPEKDLAGVEPKAVEACAQAEVDRRAGDETKRENALTSAPCAQGCRNDRHACLQKRSANAPGDYGAGLLACDQDFQACEARCH
jgi:hypothetical protein